MVNNVKSKEVQRVGREIDMYQFLSLFLDETPLVDAENIKKSCRNRKLSHGVKVW